MARKPNNPERLEYRDCPMFLAHEQFLTRDEMDVVVRRTVKETLLSMGIDAADPIEMQRDFQTLRDWRRASTSIRTKALLTAVGLLAAGILGALWIGVKSVLKS
jgi:hypothetical protein